MTYQLACLHLWIYLLDFVPILSGMQFNQNINDYKFQASEARYLKNFPYFVLLSVWMFFLILFCILKYFQSEDLDKVKQVFDDCTSVTSLFRYLVKLRIGSASSYYQRKKASIMIDFMSSQKTFLTRIAVSPFWFPKEISEEHQTSSQVVKILIHRSHPIPQVGFIRINHDSHYPLGGVIYVYSVTFRDLGQNLITFVPIFAKIKPNLPDDSPDAQVFKAKEAKFCSPDHETYLGQVSPYISKSEHLLFLFAFCNLSLLFASITPNLFMLIDKTPIFNGLVSFVLTFLVIFIFILIFRLIIKRKYSLHHGCKPWSWIRLIFIYSIFINSCIIGLITVFLEADFDSNHIFLWLVSNLTSYISAFVSDLAYFK